MIRSARMITMIVHVAAKAVDALERAISERRVS
jgi:hypothetical protein